MEDIMSAPAWFNYDAYVANKLAQLQAAEPDANWTAESMQAAFTASGYSNDADGMYRHFVDYGNAENVSPSPYFVVSEYMANKLAQMQAAKPDAGWDMAKLEQAFKDAGLSAWDHYEQFGQAEGISPSSLFDTSAYLKAKLAQLQATEPKAGWETVDQVVKAFQENGLNPIEHYVLFGVNENLSYSPVMPEPPVTDKLTTARDVLNLGAGDQIIGGVASTLSAEKTLNENDLIDGGEGNDTLRVTMDANFNGFTVTDDPNTTGGMKNVENVELTNNGQLARTFSAKGSEGVTTYTLHAGKAGTGAINLKDLAAAGVTVNVDGLQKGTTGVQFATGALTGDNDSLTFGLNNVGAAAASATADPTYVGLSATTGLESVTVNASGANYADLSKLDVDSLAVTGAGSLDVSAVNAALTSLDASAATGNVSADLTGATEVKTVKGGAGNDTFTVKGLAVDAVLEGGAGNDTLVLDGLTGVLQPTVSGFEAIGVKNSTGVTLSAKNAQDFTTLQLEEAKVTVANLSGGNFTVNALGKEDGTSVTTNEATIADAVDLTINVNAAAKAEKTQQVTNNVTASAATNAVINVGSNVAEKGAFKFGAAQSVQLNVASNKVDDAEQTSFDGTITAVKAQSLEVKAEGALGTNAKFEVANADSVVLDAAQGGRAAIVAGKATDVRLTAGANLTLTGSELAAAQSVTVVQKDGKLDGSTIDLQGLNSLTVSGDGKDSAVEFKNLGKATNEYNLSVVASGLAAGFTAGTVDSKGDISLDFAAVTGDVATDDITGGADVSVVASQLGDNTFGTINAVGDVNVQALGLLGDTFKVGNITVNGESSNVKLAVDGAGTATIGDIDASAATKGSVNVDLSGYMGAATTIADIKGNAVTVAGSELKGTTLTAVEANSLNFTGGLEADVVTKMTAKGDKTTITLDTGAGADTFSLTTKAASSATAKTEVTIKGDMGGDTGDTITIDASANLDSGSTIDFSGLKNYATSTITGSTGASGLSADITDTIKAGDGNDTINLKGDADATHKYIANVSLGEGDDTINITAAVTGSSVVTITGFDTGDKISGFTAKAMDGGAGTDTSAAAQAAVTAIKAAFGTDVTVTMSANCKVAYASDGNAYMFSDTTFAATKAAVCLVGVSADDALSNLPTA